MVEAFDEAFDVLMKTLVVGVVGGIVTAIIPLAGILVVPAVAFIFVYLTLTSAERLAEDKVSQLDGMDNQ